MSKYSSAAESRVTGGGGIAAGLVMVGGGLVGSSLAANRGVLLFCVDLVLECKNKKQL